MTYCTYTRNRANGKTSYFHIFIFFRDVSAATTHQSHLLGLVFFPPHRDSSRESTAWYLQNLSFFLLPPTPPPPPNENNMSVTYSSTRGGQKNLDFRTVVMQGLAHDRGLFVPDWMPTVTTEELESWRSLSYADLAVKVISKFVQEDQVPLVKLEDIVKRSCGAFRSPDVTPVVAVDGHYVLVRLLLLDEMIFLFPSAFPSFCVLL
jgi:hypothetical protein